MKFGIVLGSPRSGTTFLMRMLETVREVESVSGNLLPTCIPHIVNQDIPSDIKDALKVGFQKALTDYLESGWFNARASALRKWANAGGGISGLTSALTTKTRKIDHLVYKEPFLAFAPQFTYESIPDAPIIHIYRDGRDCANSLVKSYDVLSDEKLKRLNTTEMPLGRKWNDDRFIPWWVGEGAEDLFLSSTPFVRSTWMWKEMVMRCQQFFSDPAVQLSDRILLVKYERLMHEPLEEGKRVLDRLGLKMGKKTIKMLQSAHTKSIGSYKKRDDEEIASANEIAGEALKLYGYQ